MLVDAGASTSHHCGATYSSSCTSISFQGRRGGKPPRRVDARDLQMVQAVAW